MRDDSPHLFRSFLESLGLDLSADPELERTPERVSELLADLFGGLEEEPPVISAFPTESAAEAGADHGAVVVAALPFASMCVHHLLPFFGTVDVAYLPGKTMIGFGSVGRVVDHFARRPQVQERLIQQITDYLADALEPRGLLVRLRTRQLCMEMRGAQKRGELVSLAARGELREGSHRTELLAQFHAAERPL